jgi:hypothetical protein
LMMLATKRPGRLVAHLSAKGARLSDFEMVNIAWARLANEAGP